MSSAPGVVCCTSTAARGEQSFRHRAEGARDARRGSGGRDREREALTLTLGEFRQSDGDCAIHRFDHDDLRAAVRRRTYRYIVHESAHQVQPAATGERPIVLRQRIRHASGLESGAFVTYANPDVTLPVVVVSVEDDV